MKLIGKGTFTKAYLLECGTSVFLESTCPIKECMSLGWFPESTLFPEIERLDDIEKQSKIVYTYKMEFYPKPLSLKTELEPREYLLYQELRKLKITPPMNRHLLFNEWHKAFNSLPDEFRLESEILREALDACGNFGSDIAFEISPRNVRVKNGKLILLDCFFSVSKLNETRSK